MTHSPLLEIQLGDAKAVGRLGELTQAFPRPGVRYEDTIALFSASPNAATQLVELGQAETLRVLYQHDGGVGNVDTYLDHRGGHENVDLAVSERSHGSVTVLGLHPSVYQAHLERAQIVAQPFGHGGRSLEIHFF